MRLKSYLAQDGKSASKLAEAVGVAVSTITRAAAGETLPNASTRKRILEETEGEVTSADLFAEHEEYHARRDTEALADASTRQTTEMSCQEARA
ncbi:helix-turn-helix transcriptional regulator [Sphingopyxis sp. J-6]|uniref:helix-turn-helix domain-containing protein n=1 Tax=Sphingopyxis sp. J-6 TaxID=3122054 RepID=UPI003983EDB0